MTIPDGMLEATARKLYEENPQRYWFDDTVITWEFLGPDAKARVIALTRQAALSYYPTIKPVWP